MGVLFLLFLCLVVLFPWVYVFYTYFFFNVYTWSSPIKILIDFEIFLWNSYSLIFVFHQGHVIYVSVFRESFLYFFRKKNITTFSFLLYHFVKCTYIIEKSCQILILQSIYIICCFRFRIFALNFKDPCLHFIVYNYLTTHSWNWHSEILILKRACSISDKSPKEWIHALVLW